MTPEPEENPDFTPEEVDTMRRVQKNRTWRLVCDAMALERERLFQAEPGDSNALWKQRGAIEQIQRLLHQGPLLVVLYQRHMRERTQGSDTESPPASQLARPVFADEETPDV